MRPWLGKLGELVVSFSMLWPAGLPVRPPAPRSPARRSASPPARPSPTARPKACPSARPPNRPPADPPAHPPTHPPVRPPAARPSARPPARTSANPSAPSRKLAPAKAQLPAAVLRIFQREAAELPPKDIRPKLAPSAGARIILAGAQSEVGRSEPEPVCVHMLPQTCSGEATFEQFGSSSGASVRRPARRSPTLDDFVDASANEVFSLNDVRRAFAEVDACSAELGERQPP